jgi:Ca2+-binding EF-hand superfamily protein
MNRPFKFAIAISAALTAMTVIVATTAHAAPETAGKATRAAVDTDRDGRVSREEAAPRAKLAKNFDAIDTNKDGFLSREELRAWHAKQDGAKGRAIDTDKDGRISRAEAEAKAPRLAKNFDRVDANKDGYLSKDEMAATRRLMRERNQ